MLCPKCSITEMREETSGLVRIDRCQTCHGIWLDELELERLLEQAPRELLADDALFATKFAEPEERLNCPRCHGTYLIKLSSLKRRGVTLDSCVVCHGTWLDAGEFARLAGKDVGEVMLAVFRG